MIGENIKDYLTDHGINLKFLSKKSQVPYARLYAALNGKNKNISVIDYRNICFALELPLDYFLKGEVNEDAEDDDSGDQ